MPALRGTAVAKQRGDSMMRLRFGRCGSLIALVATVGCWNSSDEPALPEGNDTLGIVRFVEEEVADQTTLRGFDASGNEVARLDLVHGRYTATPPFTEENDTP